MGGKGILRGWVWYLATLPCIESAAVSFYDTDSAFDRWVGTPLSLGVAALFLWQRRRDIREEDEWDAGPGG
jgi:hypothetical protein